MKTSEFSYLALGDGWYKEYLIIHWCLFIMDETKLPLCYIGGGEGGGEWGSDITFKRKIKQDYGK